MGDLCVWRFLFDNLVELYILIVCGLMVWVLGVVICLNCLLIMSEEIFWLDNSNLVINLIGLVLMIRICVFIVNF